MKTFTIVEAQSRISASLSEIGAGTRIATTCNGKIVARQMSDRPRVAADTFRDFWVDKDLLELDEPEDTLADDVASLDG